MISPEKKSSLSHIWCPACGWFGRRARRRAERVADENLIRFHAALAAATINERKAR